MTDCELATQGRISWPQFRNLAADAAKSNSLETSFSANIPKMFIFLSNFPVYHIGFVSLDEMISRENKKKISEYPKCWCRLLAVDPSKQSREIIQDGAEPPQLVKFPRFDDKKWGTKITAVCLGVGTDVRISLDFHSTLFL
jgi:hypothetical protein